MVEVPQNADLAGAIRATAERLGVDPTDIATVISYESRFSPSIYGGAGGRHLGLIQFGPEEQQKYGVKPDQSAAEQMGAVENYLRDRGVKPGMGLLDLYSTVNAGRPGRYNASDANNGGLPGTVADKVTSMAPHRVRASLLLDGKLPGGVGRSAPAQAAPIAQGGAPMGLAPAGAPASDDGLAALVQAAQQIAASAHEGGVPEMPDLLPPLQVGPLKMGFGRMRRG